MSTIPADLLGRFILNFVEMFIRCIAMAWTSIIIFHSHLTTFLNNLCCKNLSKTSKRFKFSPFAYLDILDSLFQVNQNWEIMGTKERWSSSSRRISAWCHKEKKNCIHWNVFYNMCKIQNYPTKSAVKKKLMKNRSLFVKCQWPLTSTIMSNYLGFSIRMLN